MDARGYFLDILPDHILDDSSPEAVFDAIWALRDVPMRDERWAPVLAVLSNQFRREYLADWVRDKESLVYLPTERNLLPEGWELPTEYPWRITIGCHWLCKCFAGRRIDCLDWHSQWHPTCKSSVDNALAVQEMTVRSAHPTIGDAITRSERWSRGGVRCGRSLAGL